MPPQVTLLPNKIIIKQLKGYEVAYEESEDSLILTIIPKENQKINE